MPEYMLKLYITGFTPRAKNAIANLQRICTEELDETFNLQIIDVIENPQLAKNERIIATPTLIKALPAPIRHIVGDLSDIEKILLGLDIRLSKNAKIQKG